MKSVLLRIVVLLAVALAAAPLRAEDGYELWLRYPRVTDAARLAEYRAALPAIVIDAQSATLRAARDELRRGLNGLLGAEVPISARAPRGGAFLVAGTPASSAVIRSLRLDEALRAAGDEGYVIRTVDVGGRRATVIAANRDVGVLYGTFHLLRHLQSHASLAGLSAVESPRVERRILDHWDNLDRSVERGYAGRSLWDWDALPNTIDPRYTDYARANASIGINGTVLTNVNANAQVLTPGYLRKVRALADVFRPYGIRVYLTARFSAPMEIGGLRTADPLDPAVRAWWKAKADEIYRVIPDFGGFLVKANSEGQPGPQDYRRTHADGANMLAEAVAPHGGIVMWRAFVYSAEEPTDRVKQAYDEFHPLDGRFAENVLVQVKNGPLDFQPREPFHPLFGAMPRTPMMLELQVTQEYLGQASDLVYLAPMWEEVLDADTYARGEGSTVARVVDGSLEGHRLTGIAGVANTGTDRDWTGHPFHQANWYAFGRLAWDPALSSAGIADEWIRMTFTDDPAFVAPVRRMMLGSREVAVNYMTPLGLHHIMARDHHYGPGPWVTGGRADWTSVYYHRADTLGIGFDRTPTGSNAVSQYFAPVRDRFADRRTVGDSLLLWFHRVGWDERMASGRTLWEELVHRYSAGVDSVRAMRRTWDALAGRIDGERHAAVAQRLATQERVARWWRDASLLYFQQFAGKPIPPQYERPARPLEFYTAHTSDQIPDF
ncbi:alpha-glucuronidase family glycosyl hydrolase [Longimicrobium sp.]|uniref:alpha-glucuronidase family glycosyl hydrolase n=1 Tax=Longimicrobium sp. TaxID=2029185 RepID=UPI002E2F337B|nr:alpha-glucuronidase family glycosyl hydrolase [Longimicrobium sp.]HEX6040767.1 alpha-glucuronidase family glycosyl hydrolase [Longimicrobium sp.]